MTITNRKNKPRGMMSSIRCASLLKKHFLIVILVFFTIIIKEEVPFFKALLLAISQLLLIYIPGITVLNLSKLNFKNNLIFVLCAYATGYMLSIVFYIIMLLFGIQEQCWIAYIIYLLIILFIAIKKKETQQAPEATTVENIIFYTCLLIALVVGIIIYVLPNRSAQVVGYQNMMGDLTYWFKNCIAATKGYPLPELSISGLNLSWHMFSCFEIAFLHFVTGIEIYNLCFTFSYIWKMLLLVGGVYVLASTFLKKNRHVLIVMLVTLFTSGLDVQTCVYYTDHLFRCSLAFEEGYAFSMFGFVIFHEYIKSNRKNPWAYFLTLMTVFCATGLKVSGGVLLLVGIGVSFLFNIGKNWKERVGTLLIYISYCLAFLIVAKLFLIDGNALTSSTSSHQILFSPFDTIFRSGHYEVIYDTLRTGFTNKYFAYIITVFIYLIQSNYAVVIPFIVSFVFVLLYRNWKTIVSKDVLPLLAISFCGTVLFIFSNHPGFSQVYFYFNTFAFTSLATMIFAERIECKHKKVINIAVSIVAAILIMWSCNYNIQNYQSMYLLNPEVYQTGISKQSTGQNDVSSLEMTGLRWVRENLPCDVVLATNKVLVNNPEGTMFSRTFITSEYSERQVFLEGFSSTNLPSNQFVLDRLAILRQYYEGLPGASAALKQEGNVTHAIVFKGIQDPTVNLEGQVVYENDDITVIDIRE